MSRGGQRIKSVLFYLNDEFEGGETNFPMKGIKVKPVKSKAIIWDNINEDGTLDYESIHAGLPVISGFKYIATIWIRENKFK
jgi:prolyl 4-hydroxylase